ncbi:circadian clock protein KaiB [Mucilaginibacter sp. PAMC 26640]|nr:circadian clock protein KaiB [Mucilaginibacter sp. PAMC 26640]
MAAQERSFMFNEDDSQPSMYILRLFIIGASPNSIRAIENIKAICDQYLNENYDLKIIDVHQQPELTQNEDIIALPLLINKAPGTERRLIGDMSDIEKVLKGLGIPQTK